MSDPAVKFSVIIPTYNRCDFITKTIESVLNQQYPNFEIIVVNDGSNDDTETAVRAIVDPRIKYLYKLNEERAAARNFGVLNSNGDYITFLDSDDILLSNHLSTAAEFICQDSSPPIFHQGYDIANQSGKIIKRWKKLPDPVNEKLAEGNFLSCLGVFVRRDIIVNNLFNEDRDLSGSEDYELWLRLAARHPIRTLATVTATLVDHKTRSVITIDVGKLIKRIFLLQKYLNQDATFLTYYKGTSLKKFHAYRCLYVALHLTMRENKTSGWYFLYRAMKHRPMIVRNFRFWVVLKKLIIN
ncbi:MAG: glycosyltransferase family 2 protein [Bacteroidetes bacterium]|nr:glycosyltransferase family 2 protein [Bacteroidota bacterium]